MKKVINRSYRQCLYALSANLNAHKIDKQLEYASNKVINVASNTVSP